MAHGAQDAMTQSTQNTQNTEGATRDDGDGASALDIIARRFQSKPVQDAGKPLPSTALDPLSPALYIIAEIPALNPTQIVIVIDHAAAKEVKQKFTGHALWSAEELVFFMERFFTFHDTDNGPRWTRRTDIDPEATTENITEHFIAINRIKAATKGFLSRRT